MKGMSPLMVTMIMLIMLAGTLFAAWGFSMHQQVETKEAAFHALQESYFSQSKSVRDGAETGSKLNQDLVTIQQTPSELLRLKLVGIGRILIGIFIVLFGIMIALIMMPKRLGKVLREHGQQ